MVEGQLSKTYRDWFTYLWSAIAIASFHLAYLIPPLAFLMVLFTYALIKLTELPTARAAFYTGLAIALACYAPHLWFFWGIFHWVAGSLWLILAIWVAFFLLIAWHLRRVPGIRTWAFALALPILWTGLEYFRSELYYLKFAWLTPGIAFGNSLPICALGTYGTGFLLFTCAAVIALLPLRKAAITGIIIITTGLALLTNLSTEKRHYPSPNPIRVVTIQLESPSGALALDALDTAVSEHPDVALIVMSEYTLTGSPSEGLKKWCRSHGRYLIIGGIKSTGQTDDAWADTAFVIDPKGDIIFSQGKSVPIQFFRDGQPATEQRLWDSPWGKIGICICYDLSYSRVTDELIRQAEILIVPSMDAVHWGPYEHALHARIAPMRAAEYNIPIIRATSSGISQIIRPDGTTAASLPYPDQSAIMSGELITSHKTHVPLDRTLAPLCTLVTALIALSLLTLSLYRFLHKKPSPPPPT